MSSADRLYELFLALLFIIKCTIKSNATVTDHVNFWLVLQVSNNRYKITLLNRESYSLLLF